MKQKFLQKNKAFTLVETLVAISIFSISILGLLSVLTTGVVNTTYDKNKVVASYLAQEGIEYMRNMRDTYVLYDTTSPSNGWTLFRNKLTSCTSSVASCGFNNVAPGPSTTISPCSGNTCELYLNQGVYSIDHSTGGDSGFARKVWMTVVDANKEVKIFSEIDWKQGSNTSTITFSENLFEWVE